MGSTTELRILAEGLRFPEGPVAMPDGSVVLVEIASGTLTRVAPDGSKSTVATPGAGPNGIALGPDGKILRLQQRRLHLARGAGHAPRRPECRRLQRRPDRGVDPATGSVTRLYDRCGEHSLKGPNDIVFAGQPGRGRLLVQRPRQGPDAGPRPRRGLLGGLDGSAIVEVAFPIVGGANGIGLSPDGRTLYVAGDRDRPALGLGHRGAGRGAQGSLARRPTAAGVICQLPGYRRLRQPRRRRRPATSASPPWSAARSPPSPRPARSSACVKMPDRMPTNICFGGRTCGPPTSRFPRPASWRRWNGTSRGWCCPSAEENHR